VRNFLKFVSSPSLSSPAKIFAEGPGGDESGNSVVVNWVLGTCDTADVQSEKAVMCGILLNHGGSPLYKALVDSGLGEDLSPQVGFSSYLYNSVFSVGLRGVKKGDEKKVEKVIFDTLEKIVKDGISEKDIESTLMSMEFAQREIKRLSGPYSKTLMAKIVYGWLYGFDMSRQIRQRDTLDKIKSKIKNDPRFFENKMKSLLLDNLNRSLVVVTPSENYTKSRAESEKAIARELLSKTSVEKVRSDLTQSIEKVRADLTLDMEKLRGEFRTEIEKTRAEIEKSRAEAAKMNHSMLKWMIGIWASMGLGLLLAMAKGFHWLGM